MSQDLFASFAAERQLAKIYEWNPFIRRLDAAMDWKRFVRSLKRRFQTESEGRPYSCSKFSFSRRFIICPPQCSVNSSGFSAFRVELPLTSVGLIRFAGQLFRSPG
ncbi:MAG: hypothetical protein LBT05_08375 [Planctomycetaceae bacterium]|nr:hypothetical protein [Planctomycetaceae bacterium]